MLVPKDRIPNFKKVFYSIEIKLWHTAANNKYYKKFENNMH